MLSVRRDGACLVLANNRGKFEWGLYGLYKRLHNYWILLAISFLLSLLLGLLCFTM